MICGWIGTAGSGQSDECHGACKEETYIGGDVYTVAAAVIMPDNKALITSHSMKHNLPHSITIRRTGLGDEVMTNGGK